mgnify:FL=1
MFDEFGECVYDTEALEKQICDLMEDDEIMRKSGIYRYVLSGDLRNLSFRTFDKKTKSAKLTSDRKEFAYIATSTLNWRKWKQTTSPLGKKVVRL